MDKENKPILAEDGCQESVAATKMLDFIDQVIEQIKLEFGKRALWGSATNDEEPFPRSSCIVKDTGYSFNKEQNAAISVVLIQLVDMMIEIGDVNCMKGVLKGLKGKSEDRDAASAAIEKLEAHLTLIKCDEADAEAKSSDDVAATQSAGIPDSVKDVFLQPAFSEKYVREMVRCYAKNGEPKKLALIYCVLRDYGMLKRELQANEFIQALMDWDMLEPMDDKTFRSKCDGMAAYLHDRQIEGKIRKGLALDFKSWADGADKRDCYKIASVFGNDEGVKVHYKYKNRT